MTIRTLALLAAAMAVAGAQAQTLAQANLQTTQQQQRGGAVDAHGRPPAPCQAGASKAQSLAQAQMAANNAQQGAMASEAEAQRARALASQARESSDISSAIDWEARAQRWDMDALALRRTVWAMQREASRLAASHGGPCG